MRDLWRALANSDEMKWSRFAGLGALIVLVSGVARGSVAQGAVSALSFVVLAGIAEEVGRRYFAPQARPVVATEDIVAARGALGVNTRTRAESGSQTIPSNDASAGIRPGAEGDACAETRKRARRRGGTDPD